MLLRTMIMHNVTRLEIRECFMDNEDRYEIKQRSKYGRATTARLSHLEKIMSAKDWKRVSLWPKCRVSRDKFWERAQRLRCLKCDDINNIDTPLPRKMSTYLLRFLTIRNAINVGTMARKRVVASTTYDHWYAPVESRIHPPSDWPRSKPMPGGAEYQPTA